MSEKRFTVRRDEKGAILIPNSILKDGEIIDEKETVDLLNEYDDFKTELTEILQEEYAHLTKGMIKCGREENWVGYRAFQLERSPIIRIARKLRIDLNG